MRCCRCYSIFNALATLTVDGPASARAVERLDAALPAGPPVIVDSDEVIDGNATTGEYPVLPPELLQTLPPGLNPGTPGGLAVLNMEVNRQAAMLAYVSDFRVMMWVTLLTMPLLLLIRPPPSQAA